MFCAPRRPKIKAFRVSRVICTMRTFIAVLHQETQECMNYFAPAVSFAIATALNVEDGYQFCAIGG
jgi:hypothetical protein